MFGLGLACALAAGCGSVAKTPADGGAGGTTTGTGGATVGTGGATTGTGGTPAGTGGTLAGTGGATAGTGGATGVVDAGPAPDAGSDAPVACDVSSPFGTPVLLTGVDGMGSNGEGRLSPDELTIYFYSDRSGNNDIFMATRPSRTSAFGTPQALTSVNTTGAEGWPSPTADGLSLFLESSASGAYQVLVSTRTTLVAQFSAPSVVANVNLTGFSNVQPFVLADESAIYFGSNRTGTSGGYDLYRSARDTSGQFGAPVQVSTINSPSDEYGPTPSANELTLYFGSIRPDSPAKGNFDIWMAKRASPTANFDPPVNVQELNTTDAEWPDWLSPDACRLYFTRTSANVRNIYVATRAM